MNRVLLFFVMLLVCVPGISAESVKGMDYVSPEHIAGSAPNQDAEQKLKQEEDKKWWKQREKRSDIFYPHNAHLDVMEQEGDSCMLCHTYSKTDITDPKKLAKVTVIANEALKPICHSCHVEEKRGPWRCDLCHDDKEKIWPADHRSDYINHHGEIARQNEKYCETCHLDMNFCTDCHLRRDTSGQGYHPLGYRTLHGLESRLDAGRCGRCHNDLFCSDCHAAQ
ncbi:MAG: hypothetical protein ABL925_06325 [Methylococcales bacterium]